MAEETLEKVAHTAINADQILDRAVEVIGDKNRAMRWLGTPVRALGYSTPVSLFGTQKGREKVLAALGRLEHGVL